MRKSPPEREIVVTSDSRERLDLFLSRTIEGLSRRAAAAMIEEGAVTVDGRRAEKSLQIARGGVIAIRKPIPLAMWAPLPDASVRLSVLYQDEVLAAVDKPSGIPSVPLAPDEIGTLAGGVVSIFPECATVGRKAGDGGLLQRLDKETSGVVLIARAQTIHGLMTEAQNRGDVEKRYLALVEGAPPATLYIDTPLLSFGRKGVKMRPDPRGQKALTEVRLLSLHGDFSLVEATIHRGVRHQIRVHLASSGFPIVNDRLYGGVGELPEVERLFLHAHEVTFRHPVNGQSTTVRAPLSEELAAALSENSLKR